LKGAGMPSNGGLFDYQCAEAVKDNYDYDYNAYFNPQIKVRTQGCFGVCWFEDKTLSYNGECAYFATSSLVIPMRICARVAFKGYDGEVDDDGYMYINNDTTKPGHLTSKGYSELDRDYSIEEIRVNEATGAQTTSTVTYKIYPPKICAYKDPDLFVTWMKNGGPFSNIGQIVTAIQSDSHLPTIDYLDWNPTSQPLHKTTYGSPIISILIFLIGQAVNLADMLGGALEKLFKNMNSDFLVDVMNYIQEAVDFIGPIILDVLTQLNSLNRIVDGSLGCVNVPLGPPPPPFCPTLSNNYRPLEMHQICKTNHDGTVQVPTLQEQCQKSSTANKYLSPTIRATFDYLIPTCKANVSPSNSCVTFTNVGSPQIMRNLYGGLDFVPKCGGAITSGCVNTSFAATTSWTYNNISYSGYRLVYGYKASASISTPLDSYIYPDAQGTTHYPDCANTSNGCIFLYGINSGPYYDMNMSFPTTEPTYNNSDLTTTRNFTLQVGSNTQSITALAKIVRTTDDTKPQSQGQLCLYDNADNRQVGCQERLTPPKPIVYSCGSPSANITCTSTHFLPKMVASVESAGMSSQGVVTPITIDNGAAVKVNLGGRDYDSFVTDANFRTIPYSPPADHAYSANSRYGNYVGDVNPFSTTGEIYIDGLEYDYGRYIVGGEKLCLTGYEYQRCSTEYNKNCVLTQLVDGVASSILANRITPTASAGPTLSDSQYFNYGVTSFDRATQTIRDKTPIEMNLCVAVPTPPKCAAVAETSANEASGFATWPESAPSENVTGTCLPDYISADPNGPQRACYLNKTTKTSSYQGVIPGTECLNGLKLNSQQKWQKIPISMITNDIYDINITGEVSLCKGYVPSNNLQQSSANDSSGNAVAIPRLSETNNNGVGLKLNPRDNAWKNVADLYPGDKLSVMVGPKNICEYLQICSANQTFYNVMTKSNESANCSPGLQDYHALCGTIGVWNNKPYDSDWFSGGSGLLHQISNLSPQLGTISPRNLNWSDRPVYASADGMAGYKILYQNFNNSVSGTYQIKYSDSNYDDNHGGYIIYVKQTKCVRTNGQPQTDAGKTNRGQIKAYFATSGENPNTTNPAGSDLSVSASGAATFTATGNGYLWLKIDNNDSDYAKSYGMYDITMTKRIFCPASTSVEYSQGFATWPQTPAGVDARGTCDYPGAVLPYRTCLQSGNSAAFSSVATGSYCTDPAAAYIFPYGIYNPTSDGDYINSTSGAILDASYLQANLARSNPSANNSYSYKIYFALSGPTEIASFSINSIKFFGNPTVTLNGTTIFNKNTTNLTGWTNSTAASGTTYFANSATSGNVKQYLVAGLNTINIDIPAGTLYNSLYAPTTIIFNYAIVPWTIDWGGGFDFGGGFSFGGGGK
jgi:hypothetical protein